MALIKDISWIVLLFLTLFNLVFFWYTVKGYQNKKPHQTIYICQYSCEDGWMREVYDTNY